MKMVSATKFHRAVEAQRKARAYAEQMQALFGRIASAAGLAAHPLMTPRAKPRHALLLVFTSDKGLCGGFNNRLVKEVSLWLADHKQHYERIDLSFCGRRGFNYFRTRARMRRHYEGITHRPQFENAVAVGKELCEIFLDGRYDEVFLAFNLFKSALTQTPLVRRLLPLQPDQLPKKADGPSPAYLFEPKGPDLLAWMLPRMVAYSVFEALIENAAGEHGARMTAMDNATSNADKVISHTTLLRNRARQASITKELIEIISGAEALT